MLFVKFTTASPAEIGFQAASKTPIGNGVVMAVVAALRRLLLGIQDYLKVFRTEREPVLHVIVWGLHKKYVCTEYLYPPELRRQSTDNTLVEPPRRAILTVTGGIS
jgi:hypothetical protein